MKGTKLALRAFAACKNAHALFPLPVFALAFTEKTQLGTPASAKATGWWSDSIAAAEKLLKVIRDIFCPFC